MAVFRLAGALDLEVRRWVAVDRTQQVVAARGDAAVTRLTGGAVAHQTEGGVLDQRLARHRQGLEVGSVEQAVVVRQALGPVALGMVERFGAGEQFLLARRPVVDALDQPGVLHRAHGVGGDRGKRELLSQLDARAGDLHQFEQAERTVLVEEVVVEADLLEFPDVFDHSPGLLGREVQLVFPEVAVLQATVFGQLLPVRDQREQAGIAAHQAFPGIEDAVVHAFDVGAEVQRVAEQGSVVAGDVGLVDAQQGVAEHRRRAVQVGRGEHQHRAVRVDVAVPVVVFAALRLREVVELQLLAQPAGARRVDALGMLVAKAGRGIERL